MNRFFSSLVNVCFIFSIFFIAAACAKKAPTPPSVAPKAAVEQPSAESEGFLEIPPAEETLFGESDLTASSSNEVGEEFLAAGSGGFSSKDYRATPNLSSVHFDFDQYVIKAEDQIILDRNAAWLSENPDTFVRVEGHCDARGTSDYNLALGDRRAHAVKNYLISLGISSSRILTLSFGEEIPLCTDLSESCWAQNRRGDFLIAE